MSRPRKTCRESQLTTSACQRSANSNVRDVFPLPVGPTSAMISSAIREKDLHTEARRNGGRRGLSVSPCLRVNLVLLFLRALEPAFEVAARQHQERRPAVR